MRTVVICFWIATLLPLAGDASSIVSFSRETGSGIRLSWPAGDGAVLERTDNLGQQWLEAVGPGISLTTNAATVTAVDIGSAASIRYFRLRYPSPSGPAFDIGQIGRAHV